MLTSFHSSSFCSCRTEYINELPPWKPIPVAAGFKACVCGRLLAGVAGSSAAGGMDVLSLERSREFLPNVVRLSVISKPQR